ncbi:hypothetical protein AVEN_195695-1 [Araneus ventricosus]|uniref:Uncharacterized protein n=1 Tax=Araneus ventricosus TaxID=182803 RepID=A0A4Y2BAD1_ARAVE|nr:hypothetical protein AVEN_195695-1 [Araneus ventricosus]
MALICKHFLPNFIYVPVDKMGCDSSHDRRSPMDMQRLLFLGISILRPSWIKSHGLVLTWTYGSPLLICKDSLPTLIYVLVDQNDGLGLVLTTPKITCWLICKRFSSC